MYKYLNISILILTMTATVAGQTKKAFMDAADKAFIGKNYYAALTYYNTVLEFDEKDPIVVFKAAESARHFNAYARAAEKYSFLLDSLKDNSFPIASFWLAEMNQRLGKYDEADRLYNQYLSEYADDDAWFTEKAKKELAAVQLARQLTDNVNSRYTVTRLGEDVNSVYSEVGAHTFNKDLYFTSMRLKETKPLTFPARDISKIFRKSKENSVEVLADKINERDQLVANSVINKAGSKMYYTVCEYINGSEIRCDIYVSDREENGALSNELKIPAPINLAGTTTTHPNIITDIRTGKEILYFVSDRAGGAGGLDIWYSVLDEKYGFSEPVNIKEINTAYDEITPYFHAESGVLYFSTDGREGLGGYDLYKSAKTGDQFGQIINLGAPLNSSYNDIYYFLESSGDKAYLSSNREGSLFLDAYHESCCYDIYEVDLQKIQLDLNALTYDKLTGRVLKNATVRLIEKRSGTELARITNDEGNEHFFPLDEDREYMIIAERENYYPDTIYLSTFGYKASESIVRKMYLETDMMLLDVFTYTKIGKLPLEGVTVTLIDLTDQTRKEIVVTNPAGNDFYFMLDRGKQYKLSAKKDGYTDTEELVDTRPFEKSGLIRKDLYLDKFVLQDLLPIALYFDNDLPDIRSRATTTKAKYGDLVADYVNKKELYKQKYAQPLKNEDKQRATELFEQFFEGEVQGGYDKLKLFMISLIQELEAGNKVELVFKGFASPRAESKYNLVLGQRRVNSVKNEMIIYGNQELQRYFKSGQLKITDISFGKELAPKDVPDSLSDERNSIYSLKAAKERRVEILRASRK